MPYFGEFFMFFTIFASFFMRVLVEKVEFLCSKNSIKSAFNPLEVTKNPGTQRKTRWNFNLVQVLFRVLHVQTTLRPLLEELNTPKLDCRARPPERPLRAEFYFDFARQRERQNLVDFLSDSFLLFINFR